MLWRSDTSPYERGHNSYYNKLQTLSQGAFLCHWESLIAVMLRRHLRRRKWPQTDVASSIPLIQRQVCHRPLGVVLVHHVSPTLWRHRFLGTKPWRAIASEKVETVVEYGVILHVVCGCLGRHCAMVRAWCGPLYMPVRMLPIRCMTHACLHAIVVSTLCPVVSLRRCCRPFAYELPYRDLMLPCRSTACRCVSSRGA